LRKFTSLWQIVGMAQKKIHFGRTTIARAKSAVKRHRAAKKKKGHSQSKKPPKQVELEPKLNAFLDMPWHRMAHASARADADRDFRLRLGAAQRRPIRVGGR
jgi:hypothetical protein